MALLVKIYLFMLRSMTFTLSQGHGNIKLKVIIKKNKSVSGKFLPKYIQNVFIC